MVRIQKSVKTFLYSKISNPEDVEDLLQEVLIKTHLHIDMLHNENSVKSWLFQITNRVIINFYRKNNRLSEVDLDELWYGKRETDVIAEISNCFQPFILALSEEMTTLIKAIEIDGQSQKAYAEELGISYSTLKSIVQKSRKALRALFDECCHFRLDQQGNLMNSTQKENDCKIC